VASKTQGERKMEHFISRNPDIFSFNTHLSDGGVMVNNTNNNKLEGVTILHREHVLKILQNIGEKNRKWILDKLATS
jgi:hypothetical protein